MMRRFVCTLLIAMVVALPTAGCDTIKDKMGFDKPKNVHQPGCQRMPDLNHIPMETEEYPKWP